MIGKRPETGRFFCYFFLELLYFLPFPRGELGFGSSLAWRKAERKASTFASFFLKTCSCRFDSKSTILVILNSLQSKKS